jgi:hypothetical protein
MKNIFKTTIIGLMAVFFASCQEEELRVHFPASMPVFDNASVAETAIMYGDSITLSVGVSDPLTPLSPLSIKVVQLKKSEQKVRKPLIHRNTGYHL